MADRSRSHQRRRARAVAPRSAEAQGAPLPRVVGALLSGQLEEVLLLKAATGVARVELVDDRLALLSTILALRPEALVLPPLDESRTSTAPLVLRVRREAPAVAVVVVAAHPAGAGQPMLRAAQAGALVLASPTSDELREALMGEMRDGGRANS